MSEPQTEAETQTAVTPAAKPAGKGSPSDRAWRLLYTYGLLMAFIAVIIIFSILRPDSFPTTANAGSILTQNAAIMLISFGVMLPLIANKFDLSLGYMATMSGLLAVGFQSFNHMPVWLAIILAITICSGVGLISGILVALTKLNSLIVTLGVGSVLFGAAELYSNGATIYQNIPNSYLAVGQTRIGGVPLSFVYAAVAALIIWYILEYRPIGRFLYAIGGGEDAARLVGIRVNRIVIATFVASAFLAAMAGVIESARIGSANSTFLQATLLPAFTAAFLGATAIRPGHYNVWGTVLAVFVVGLGTTGMFMLGAPSYVEQVFDGAILLIAVGVAKLSERRLLQV